MAEQISQVGIEVDIDRFDPRISMVGIEVDILTSSWVSQVSIEVDIDTSVVPAVVPSLFCQIM